ncbi:hypothetical protein JCM10213_003348 [Rhodosporidiobolus nylandii]
MPYPQRRATYSAPATSVNSPSPFFKEESLAPSPATSSRESGTPLFRPGTPLPSVTSDVESLPSPLSPFLEPLEEEAKFISAVDSLLRLNPGNEAPSASSLSRQTYGLTEEALSLLNFQTSLPDLPSAASTVLASYEPRFSSSAPDLAAPSPPSCPAYQREASFLSVESDLRLGVEERSFASEEQVYFPVPFNSPVEQNEDPNNSSSRASSEAVPPPSVPDYLGGDFDVHRDLFSPAPAYFNPGESEDEGFNSFAHAEERWQEGYDFGYFAGLEEGVARAGRAGGLDDLINELLARPNLRGFTVSVALH